MKIVEFGIKIKDMASGAIRKFGETASKAVAATATSASKTTAAIADTARKAADTNRKVKGMADTTAQGFNEVTNAARKAGNEIDKVRQKADNAQRSAKRNTSGYERPSSAWDFVKGTALYNGAITAGSMAADFFTGAIQASLDRQKIQTSFNVLAGSEDTGKELTKQLVDLQQSTILGSEVFSAAQTMMGFGFNALKGGEDDIKSVTENLRMLGDVSMGDKDHLNGLVLAYSQVLASGKMNAGDLNQFINAGWNPLEQMSKQTGKTIGQLKEEIGEGKISFEKLREALVGATSEGGKFNNMLGKIAETPFGKMQQLNGAWEEFKIKAGNAFAPLVSFALELGNKILPFLEKMLTPLQNGIESVLAFGAKIKPVLAEAFAPIVELVSGIAGKVKAFFLEASEKATVFMTYVNNLKDLFVNHVLPVIKKVVDFVGDCAGFIYEFVSQSELLADIFTGIKVVVGAVADVVGGIISGLKWLYDHVVKPIVIAIEGAYRKIKDLVTGRSNLKSMVVVDAPFVGVPQTESPQTLDDKKTDKENKELMQKIVENTKDNSKVSDKTAKSVASSGPKVVNISLGKFFDNIVFNTTNLEESAGKIESVVTEVLSRVLLDGAKAI